ncbi:MAG: PEGA domain-containing protein [candidate division KSB1 bacterium]|nr:PEGA domain-containing protein [candidate division KSB1 bacterium]
MRKIVALIVLFSFTVTLFFSDVVYVYGQQKEEKPRIAVLPLHDTNTAAKQEGYGEAIAGMLMTNLINGRIFQVVERTEIERMMKEMAFQISGAVDSETAKQIGQVLGVDILVFGSVAKFGTLVETDIRLVDTQSGQALLAEHASSASGQEIRNMVDSLARRIEQRYLGRVMETVIINSNPEGAIVYIDGVQEGNTPLTKNLPAGEHKVRISLENYQVWERTIQVVSGENKVFANLILDPEYLKRQAEEKRLAEQRRLEAERQRQEAARRAQPQPAPAQKGGCGSGCLYMAIGAVVVGGVVAAIALSKKKEEEKSKVTVIVTIP